MAGTLDVTSSAVIAVLGFGVGHHVAALARRMRRHGVIVVFEPDVGLLRAVLERVDCERWLFESNVVVLTDADDASKMSESLRGAEGLMMMGTGLLEHPPSVARLGAARTRFYSNLQHVVRATHLTIVTTLSQARATAQNELMNAGFYAGSAGVASLCGVAMGRSAMVFAAGPGLAPALDRLAAEPDLRDRFVLIAAQTALRPMLDREIRPHFVCALDYHEISRRFYEGLTPADVEGVTLVAEAKANPAILNAFPGRVVCPSSRYLDLVLGDGFCRGAERGELPPSATVSHLCYYLARYMGADPAVLVGQDLGFTDNVYYGPGAAIHDVWAGELNEFNTLETLEWQRIKRMGGGLRKARSHDGRSVYTDEQMETYLAQFERDFGIDAEKGLRTIDATAGDHPGGVMKRNAERMSLDEVVSRTNVGGVERLVSDAISAGDAKRGSESRDAVVRRAADRLRRVLPDIGLVGKMSREAEDLLSAMLEAGGDQRVIGRLINEVHAVRTRVKSLDPAFRLVDWLNQTGQFNRVRADRAIALREDRSELEKQADQIERDRSNVRALARCAEELGGLFGVAADVLDGKVDAPTRPMPAFADSDGRAIGSDVDSVAEVGDAQGVEVSVRAGLRCVGVVLLHTRRTGLGYSRDVAAPLEEPIAFGKTAIRLTLERLARSERLSGIVVLTDDPARVAAAAFADGSGGVVGGSCDGTNGGRAVSRGTIGGKCVEIESFGEDGLAQGFAFNARVEAARRWSESNWRGGLGGSAVFDELLAASAGARALADRGAHAGLLVGGDWCAVDPALCDRLIDRHAEEPAQRWMTFSQATPGLAGFVIATERLKNYGAMFDGWCKSGCRVAPPAVGALLSYQPARPMQDVIARPACVIVEGPTRDAGLRLVADTPMSRAVLRDVIVELGERFASSSSEEIAAAAMASVRSRRVLGMDGPACVVIDAVGPGYRSIRPMWAERRDVLDASGVPHAGAVLRPDDAARIVSSVRAMNPAARISLGCQPGGLASHGGDVCEHPDAAELLSAVFAATACGAMSEPGAGLHVRTALACRDDGVIGRLAELSIDALSVDIGAADGWAYREINNPAHIELGDVLDRVQRIAGGLGDNGPRWIVPRITRCDAALGQIEAFYDGWLTQLGSAVIDGPIGKGDCERLSAIPAPKSVRERERRTTMHVRADGAVLVDPCDAVSAVAGNVLREPVEAVWSRLMDLQFGMNGGA